MKVQLKLLIDGKEAETVSCDAKYFQSGLHDKAEITKTMVERITNFFNMLKFNPEI